VRLTDLFEDILTGGALIDAARAYAAEAHGGIGQLRKYTNDPYIVHPEEVAALVATRPHTPEMIAAALLHDVVEDTPRSIEEIHQRFGPVVADLVADLTDVSKPSDGNRRVRKAMDRAHTAAASNQAKTIKLADLISNSASITAHDPNFAPVYMDEKRALLDALVGGDPVLLARAQQIVADYFEKYPQGQRRPQA
jgi:(p)ppGpp synthase/HD superfamily hydrolase